MILLVQPLRIWLRGACACTVCAADVCRMEHCLFDYAWPMSEGPERLCHILRCLTAAWFEDRVACSVYHFLLNYRVSTTFLGRVDARRSRQFATSGNCSTGINRQDHSGHPPCFIASQKTNCSTHIPTTAFCLQQTSILPSFSGFFAHAWTIHHRSVDHARTYA